MGRIRGWKKIEKNGWINKFYTMIRITYNYPPSKYEGYTVGYFSSHHTMHGERLKTFDTKTQAYRYAINWMKRHPRG